MYMYIYIFVYVYTHRHALRFTVLYSIHTTRSQDHKSIFFGRLIRFRGLEDIGLRAYAFRPWQLGGREYIYIYVHTQIYIYIVYLFSFLFILYIYIYISSR